MLSGKLPTGTVGNGPGSDRGGSGCGTAARRSATADGRNERGLKGVVRGGGPARADSGADRRERPCRADLERRLAAERTERRAVIDRYERLLERRAERTRADAGENGGVPTADLGSVRAWVRRACCRVRLRLSRRG